MPWQTPTLKEVRQIVRDDITAAVSGISMVGNSVLRVMSDADAALAHLTLRYIDWLARQLLPDTAETEWLDRHGDIWLVNADNSTGRKQAALATGTVAFSGTNGTIVPEGTGLDGQGVDASGTFVTVGYETTAQITIGTIATNGPIRALDPGSAGNLAPGVAMTLQNSLAGITTISVVELHGGADEEIDDDLRARVLLRIQQPPMGGDANDYVQWALAVPAVTRAWCAPTEMGPGTVTVRFMCDGLRATTGGFPTQSDIDAVTAYLNTVRPVTVMDNFVEAPIPEPINFAVDLFGKDTTSNRASIESSVSRMLHDRARPASADTGAWVKGTTIFEAWVSDAISEVLTDFELVMGDHPMPNSGALAVLGTVTYL